MDGSTPITLNRAYRAQHAVSRIDRLIDQLGTDIPEPLKKGYGKVWTRALPQLMADEARTSRIAPEGSTQREEATQAALTYFDAYARHADGAGVVEQCIMLSKRWGQPGNELDRSLAQRLKDWLPRHFESFQSETVEESARAVLSTHPDSFVSKVAQDSFVAFTDTVAQEGVPGLRSALFMIRNAAQEAIHARPANAVDLDGRIHGDVMMPLALAALSRHSLTLAETDRKRAVRYVHDVQDMIEERATDEPKLRWTRSVTTLLAAIEPPTDAGNVFELPLPRKQAQGPAI